MVRYKRKRYSYRRKRFTRYRKVIGDVEDLVEEVSGSVEVFSMLGERVESMLSLLKQVSSMMERSALPSTTVSEQGNSQGSLTCIGSMQLS